MGCTRNKKSEAHLTPQIGDHWLQIISPFARFGRRHTFGEVEPVVTLLLKV